MFRIAEGMRRLWSGPAALKDAVPLVEPDSPQVVFTRIYHDNLWRDDESRSGPGSRLERCRVVIAAVERLVEQLGIRSLIDAPCGDFNWMKEARLEGVDYLGIDVVRELVASNEAAYGGPCRRFRAADFVREPLPRADLIFCRDGLVHFSNADVEAALANFRRSGAKFLAATNFPSAAANADIATGDWRPLNLLAPPFRLPPPLFELSDGCPIPEYVDKSIAVWRLTAD